MRYASSTEPNSQRDLRQLQPLLRSLGIDPVQGRLAAGAIKRPAQYLAIDSHRALQLLRELRHKTLKRIAELIGAEIAKQPAKSVVAGQRR